MYFNSWFWVTIVAAFAVLQILPPGIAAGRARAGVLALAGFAGAIGILELPLLGVVVLGVSWFALWHGCRRLVASGPKDRLGIALIAVAPLLVAWVIGKTATAFEIPRYAPLLFVGMSYLVVKAWTLLKDVWDGKIKDVCSIEIAAYLLHLPTFVLGPMHYFDEFRSNLRNPFQLHAEVLVDCLYRIVLGVFKIFILAGLLAPASLLGIGPQESPDLGTLIRGAFVYSFVLYFDFSGYCDIAVAASRLLGVDVPENFRAPMLADSIRDFWRRWHITFSRALTAHVFVPLTRTLQRLLPKSPGTVSVVGYMGTFLFCGYWHGATLNFVLWGLWHALGLSIQDAWSRYTRLRGARARVKTRPVGVLLGTVATFSFVSIGWIFFVFPVARLMKFAGWA